jgi:arabinose-5-phosphate isomerase
LPGYSPTATCAAAWIADSIVRNTLIDDVMTAGGTARAEMLAAEALKIMEDHKINALVVIDREEFPVGALNMHDLLRAGVM